MRFVLFGQVHLVILAITVLASAVLIFLVRKTTISSRWIDAALAVMMALTKLGTAYFAWERNDLTLQNGLPMYLCDWTSICIVVLLLWRKQWLYEICYFWGLAGTIQAIITPDIGVPLSDPRFYTFFISHCGIVVVILYLTLGMRMRPSPFSMFKVFGITQVYLVVTIAVNYLLKANYSYLCVKPINPSLLDYLGPWPYYILSMEALTLVFFAVCYSPFWLMNVTHSRKVE